MDNEKENKKNIEHFFLRREDSKPKIMSKSHSRVYVVGVSENPSHSIQISLKFQVAQSARISDTIPRSKLSSWFQN
jgi:hypothetical protein